MQTSSRKVLVTTHSPIVLRELGRIIDSRIYVVEKVKGGQHEVPTSSVRPVENSPTGRRTVLESLAHTLDDTDLFDGWLLVE